MILSDFNYPYKIERVRKVGGYTDQATGEWIPATEETIEIRGHIQDITAKELKYLPEGAYSIGDRRLYTDADVKPGDIIRITEPDGSITEWVVKEQERNYTILAKYGIRRKSFLLKRR